MAYMCILLSQISKTIFILGTLAFKEITGIVGSMHCEFHIHTANHRLKNSKNKRDYVQTCHYSLSNPG